jgi:hypothetical protein
MAALMNE